MRRRRGFILILCLLMAGLLLVFVVAMLSLRGPLQEASNGLRWGEQAREMARAGLEDCREKLGKDLRFPPDAPPEDPAFTYSENVLDVDGTVAGSFTVRLDQSLNQAPYWVLRVSSTGILGAADHPQARNSILEIIDTCPFDRANPANPNPNPYRAISTQEVP